MDLYFPLFVSFCVISYVCPSPFHSILHLYLLVTQNLTNQSSLTVSSLLDHFAGQHLIPDTSCIPTAWLIWPCQMARDHQFWRFPLRINWTLSRSKVSLINLICLYKVHIPPAGQHCDPVRKSALISVTSIKPLLLEQGMYLWGKKVK